MSKMWDQINEVIAAKEQAIREAARTEAIKAQEAMEQAIAVREEPKEEVAFFNEYGGDPPSSDVLPSDVQAWHQEHGDGECPFEDLNVPVNHDPPYPYLVMGDVTWLSPVEFDEGMG